MTLIEFKNVTFSYPRRVRRGFFKSESQVCLDNISLCVDVGDRIGFYGSNGSGKSTLLKLMAGIFTPDFGTITRRCSISSFLNIFTGLNPDLSGLDNIRQSLLMQGYDGCEINDKLIEDIIAITRLGEAINWPMRTYSSGMYIRIPFATAIHKKSDVYIFDEWLSVGDDEFRDFANERLQDLVGQSKALVVASQSLSFLRSKCDIVYRIDGHKLREVVDENR